MNSELVRKKFTQFKLLKPRASWDEFYGILNYPIQTKDSVNGIKETREIHIVREDKTHITTIRIFS
jgi:hypothetical protein